jgi:hypothetical protein
VLTQILQEYEDDLVVLQLHNNDGYETPWGDDRDTFYGWNTLPSVQVDGLVLLSGNDANYYSLVSGMGDRLAIPSDITIDLFALPSGDQTYTINGYITLGEDAEATTVRLHLVNALFDYPENDDGRYNNCVMEGVDLGELVLTPGETLIVDHDFTFSEISWSRPEDIRIAMFAQEPLATGPAEVYQAQIISWPFPEPMICLGDTNEDGFVNTTDLLNVLGNWGTGPFDPPGSDTNGDGVVDVVDLLTVLAEWGPCDPPGACCLWDGTCQDTTWYDCYLMKNSIWSEGKSCDTFDCPDWPTGACCLGTDCIGTITEYECLATGGSWHEGGDCDTFECILTYCRADGGCGLFISNVAVGDIDNTSECDHYGDFTAQSTAMAVGSEYPITVTYKYSNTLSKGGLWIDWNQDGDFEDADETITTAWTGPGPYTETITPPGDAKLGATRLRVRLTWNKAPTPCGTHRDGEVEDYTVIVQPPAGRISSPSSPRGEGAPDRQLKR